MLPIDEKIAAIACALVVGCASMSAASAASIGGPLNLADEGMFFVHAKPAASSYPGVSPAGPARPGTVMVNQMYVHYRIPAVRTSALPIVLVHGGGLSGMSYETTPDGREGWRPTSRARATPSMSSTRPGAGAPASMPRPSTKRRQRGTSLRCRPAC